MREIANSADEFDLCNAPALALTQRVHYVLAFSRRLRSRNSERLARQFSVATGDEETPEGCEVRQKFWRTQRRPRSILASTGWFA